MLIFTKMSFPHGFASMAAHLREMFAPLPENKAVPVIVLPKSARFSTMEGARMTVVTADNFDDAVRQIDANYREFAAETTQSERIYIAYMQVERAYLHDLEQGSQPNSHDAGVLADMLRRPR